ncbi:hypothetical protein GL50803_009150 [Giardia duodenalis]|uniref:Uncharacterized protein n=1 Tax=Giardia intestinalis (strain ATCC 50803 / WB clone C6) TaxID=184922 RepID=D3KGN9_GIAIC|nr:hypothetical protein GL50803_009150 [Giardia intestinalis]KAE8306041.1 hypothetical protein GL50803_009150 [Giardia intestinalis]
MTNRLSYLPPAVDKNSIISEGRRHIANQQNSVSSVANVVESSNDRATDISSISSDGLKLPALKQIIAGPSPSFLSASDAVSSLLYELKYISLSIRSVPYRKIEIANVTLYYNIHDGNCTSVSPPGFFLIPPPTTLSTLQALKLDQKLITDCPAPPVRMPKELLKKFQSIEADFLSQVISKKDLDKIDGICDAAAKPFLHANTSFIDAGSSTEYQFLRANFKFRAAKAVFARKVQKLIPLDRNTNMNLIELLLLRPECSYLSKSTCLRYCQSRYNTSGHQYTSRSLSLSWRILTLVFPIMLLKEGQRINDHLRPGDQRLVEIFTERNIRKYLRAELYDYSATTTTPYFYRSLWSLVSTHVSLQPSLQSGTSSIHISNSCKKCAATQSVLSNDLHSIVQKILFLQSWGDVWKVSTDGPALNASKPSDHADDHMTSLNDLRLHSLEHIEEECLLDNWVISFWKHQEMNNHLVACDALITELGHLPKEQLIELIYAVAIRGTKRALRGFSSYRLWATNIELDSDLLFAQYCLLFNRPLILDIVSLELDELQWKKKLRLNTNKMDMTKLHRACPVAWFYLPSEEFQTQLYETISVINYSISQIAFTSSGVFDRLIQSSDIPNQEKLERMHSILPNVASGVLDRCLYYARTNILDSIS